MYRFNFEHCCSSNRRCSFHDRGGWEHKTKKIKTTHLTQEEIERLQAQFHYNSRTTKRKFDRANKSQETSPSSNKRSFRASHNSSRGHRTTSQLTHHVRQNECPHDDDTSRSAGSRQIPHRFESSSSSLLYSCAPARPPAPAPLWAPAALPLPSASDDSESDEVSPRLSACVPAVAVLEDEERLDRPPLGVAAPLAAPLACAVDEREVRD